MREGGGPCAGWMGGIGGKGKGGKELLIKETSKGAGFRGGKAGMSFFSLGKEGGGRLFQIFDVERDDMVESKLRRGGKGFL